MNDILGLLDALEASILESKKLPFTDKSIVDERNLLQILDKIRLSIKEGNLSRRSIELSQDGSEPLSSQPITLETPDIVSEIDVLESTEIKARKLKQDSETYAKNVLSHLQLSVMKLQKNLIQLEKTLQNSNDMLDQLKEDHHDTN